MMKEPKDARGFWSFWQKNAKVEKWCLREK